jgi:hypothetical protein
MRVQNHFESFFEKERRLQCFIPFFTESLYFHVRHLPGLKSRSPYRLEALSFLEEDGTLGMVLFHWRSPRRHFLKARSTLVSILDSGKAFCLCIVVSAADFVFCRRAGRN